MHLQIQLSVSKKLKEKFEEFLYEIFPAGWETVEEKEKITFLVFFKDNEKGKIEVVKNFAEKYSDTTFEITFIEDKDWNEVWKAGFKPLKVGNKIVVMPPWEAYNPNVNEIVVIIEPAQAFGTGHHPTTQMMLVNIEKFLNDLPEEREIKILDLGCGTGILGIACAKLFKNSKVLAVDIDEEALKATVYNAKLNGVSSKIYTSKKISEKGFDLVLANIGYKELKELSKLIKDVVKNKGAVFLSGILIEDMEKLKKEYLSIGFKIVKEERKEDWGFLWFKKV
jgi:ribosomal protein L11 methyltransferase